VANSGVSGRVVDEHGAPIQGLVVGAYDRNRILPDRFLPNTPTLVDLFYPAYARTDANGQFSISYTPGTHNLEVRIFDTVKRLLATTVIFPDVSTTSFSLRDPIIVAKAVAEGWLVSGGDAPSPVGGTESELLVDNHDCWHRIVDKINHAHQSVNFMLFFLDIGVTLMDFDPDPPRLGQAAPTNGSCL
jgi:hypothetical protein